MDFDNIWSRIKKETDLKTITELAKLVGCTQQSISNQKTKNNFPLKWAYEVELKYGILTRWIMTGEGAKRANEGYDNQFLNEVDKWLTDQKIERPGFDIWFEIEFKERFKKEFSADKKEKEDHFSGEISAA